MSNPTIRASHYEDHAPYEMRSINQTAPTRTTGRFKVTGEVIWEPGNEATALEAVRAMADDLSDQIRRARTAIGATDNH